VGEDLRHADTVDAAVVGFTRSARHPKALAVRLPDGRVALSQPTADGAPCGLSTRSSQAERSQESAEEGAVQQRERRSSPSTTAPGTTRSDGRSTLHHPPPEAVAADVTGGRRKNSAAAGSAVPAGRRRNADFGPDGQLGVMWRTTELNVYSVVSFNHGHTFSDRLQVNKTTEPAGVNGPPGDRWSTITLDKKYAYVSWADGRNGGLDAILGRVPLSAYHGGRRP
jgi:hypothetical protein